MVSKLATQTIRQNNDFFTYLAGTLFSWDLVFNGEESCISIGGKITGG